MTVGAKRNGLSRISCISILPAVRAIRGSRGRCWETGLGTQRQQQSRVFNNSALVSATFDVSEEQHNSTAAANSRPFLKSAGCIIMAFSHTVWTFLPWGETDRYSKASSLTRLPVSLGSSTEALSPPAHAPACPAAIH